MTKLRLSSWQKQIVRELLSHPFRVYATTRYRGILVRPYYRKRPMKRVN